MAGRSYAWDSKLQSSPALIQISHVLCGFNWVKLTTSVNNTTSAARVDFGILKFVFIFYLNIHQTWLKKIRLRVLCQSALFSDGQHFGKYFHNNYSFYWIQIKFNKAHSSNPLLILIRLRGTSSLFYQHWSIMIELFLSSYPYAHAMLWLLMSRININWIIWSFLFKANSVLLSCISINKWM